MVLYRSGQLSPHPDSLASFASGVTSHIKSSERSDLVARMVRALLLETLGNEMFLVDCLEKAVVSLEREAVWMNPPILDDDTNEFSVRLIYWAPNSQNHPHEHTFWTVTGVLHNELKFTTYVRDRNGQLDIEREIYGKRGEVGYIAPPCIHSVANHSDKPSISIHVFSGPKMIAGSYERGETTWHHRIDGGAATHLCTFPQTLRLLSAMLDTLGTTRALDLIERIFQMGDLSTRLECAKAMARRNQVRAGDLVSQLAAQCHGRNAENLYALAAALYQSTTLE